MPLTCNIDGRGKRVRLIFGVLLVVLGLALLWFWAMPAAAASPVRWIVSVVCLVTGAFVVFEARAGWCALRAMGIRTPL